jgi:hypothetical protein
MIYDSVTTTIHIWPISGKTERPFPKYLPANPQHVKPTLRAPPILIRDRRLLGLMDLLFPWVIFHDLVQLGSDNNSFTGTEDVFVHDVNGNLLAEYDVDVLQATRITVDF